MSFIRGRRPSFLRGRRPSFLRGRRLSFLNRNDDDLTRNDKRIPMTQSSIRGGASV